MGIKEDFLTELYLQVKFIYETRKNLIVLKIYLEDLLAASEIQTLDADYYESLMVQGYLLFPDECSVLSMLRRANSYSLTKAEMVIVHNLRRIFTSLC